MVPVRNDINPMPSWIQGWPKYFPLKIPSWKRSGRTFPLEMLFASRVTTSYRRICFLSVRVNQKACVILKHQILTGGYDSTTAKWQKSSFPKIDYWSLSSTSETNLKIKQASPQTSSFTNPNAVTSLRGKLRSEQPNNSLYTYEGALDLIMPSGVPKQVPLGPDQVLLRGAQIRNTPWVYGLTVFTGHETKLMRNATYVILLLREWERGRAYGLQTGLRRSKGRR